MQKIYEKEVNILITDDHLIVQEGLAIIIKNFLSKAVFAFADSIDSTLDSLREHRVDLLILDINIPGGNNFQMIKQIRDVQKDVKILLFSAYSEETYGLRYLKTGINGYLEKNASEYEIRNAVFDLFLRGKYLSPKMQDQLIGCYAPTGPEKSLSLLSNRELEITKLLIDGESTSGIGHRLDLKPSTVSTHKQRIFEKLNVSNMAELITEFYFEVV